MVLFDLTFFSFVEKEKLNLTHGALLQFGTFIKYNSVFIYNCPGESHHVFISLNLISSF